eukprot:TRINITY_DN4953_c0_g1_i1.p1 TRINITY_DN4953_c0_g1~~TRINITY_DN4953_c0_g1_i1.p1  ORF type:complete len:579 (-),score=119.33 TRINITY_DN4953_c0_g1_i1:179-1915(-)
MLTKKKVLNLGYVNPPPPPPISLQEAIMNAWENSKNTISNSMLKDLPRLATRIIVTTNQKRIAQINHIVAKNDGNKNALLKQSTSIKLFKTLDTKLVDDAVETSACETNTTSTDGSSDSSELNEAPIFEEESDSNDLSSAEPSLLEVKFNVWMSKPLPQQVIVEKRAKNWTWQDQAQLFIKNKPETENGTKEVTLKSISGTFLYTSSIDKLVEMMDSSRYFVLQSIDPNSDENEPVNIGFAFPTINEGFTFKTFLQKITPQQVNSAQTFRKSARPENQSQKHTRNPNDFVTLKKTRSTETSQNINQSIEEYRKRMLKMKSNFDGQIEEKDREIMALREANRLLRERISILESAQNQTNSQLLATPSTRPRGASFSSDSSAFVTKSSMSNLNPLNILSSIIPSTPKINNTPTTTTTTSTSTSSLTASNKLTPSTPTSASTPIPTNVNVASNQTSANSSDDPVKKVILELSYGLGEPEKIPRVEEAFAFAKNNPESDKQLNHIFNNVIGVGKLSKVLSLVRQDVVLIASHHLKSRINLQTRDIRSNEGWRVNILITPDIVCLSHIRREQSLGSSCLRQEY